MIARTLVALSFMTAALAASLPALSRREDSPTDADLFASCPGGPGSKNVEKADRCTLINIVNNPDVRVFKALSDPQLNCGGGTDPVEVTLTGSTSVAQTVSVSANVGFSVEGLTIGGGASTSSTTTETGTKSIQYSIPPGRQAVYVAGVNQKSQTGNIQVNYGDRQFGHFIWFTGAKITQLTPTDDIVFDVYESACGSNPNDFSSLH